MTVSISGTDGVTFNDSSVQTTAAKVGMVNRIINGAMVLDQRNAGASVTPTGGALTLDRWLYDATQNSKVTIQQNAGAVTPPVGFSNYLGVTSTSAYSIGAGDLFNVTQYIEGFNTFDLALGTASAATVTLSFRVYSSLTGTFGGALQNNARTQSYPFTYSIPVANTWTTISVTVPGSTTGTWVGATNGRGLSVFLGLGVGSTYATTAGAWASGDYRGATGATSVVGTNGATFYITGVQLEKGSTATSFDYRPYSTELALCQRYYEMFGDGCPLSLQTSTSYQLSARFLVEKRATPTFLHVTNYGVTCAGNSQTITSLLSTNSATTKGCVLNVVPNNFSGVTAGQAAYVHSSVDGLSASSEL